MLLSVWGMSGCGDAEVRDVTVRRPEVKDSSKKEEVPELKLVNLIDPDSLSIDSALLRKCPPHARFDFPVGPPDAKDYYKFRGFLPKKLEHLGEDWNGKHGGDSDYGDFVYACADGMVWEAKDYKGGWGQVIRMVHNLGSVSDPVYVETVYAHVNSMYVRPGYPMKRGDVLGTIGKGDGRYHAHLHFEIRRIPGKHIRCGYAGDTLGFVDPTQFIETFRHSTP